MINFANTFLKENTFLHKTMPMFFLIMSYSFFTVIIQQALRAYFVTNEGLFELGIENWGLSGIWTHNH